MRTDHTAPVADEAVPQGSTPKVVVCVGSAPSIDRLFGSVAEAQAARSVAALLSATGSDACQGRLFGRPAPLDQLLAAAVRDA